MPQDYYLPVALLIPAAIQLIYYVFIFTRFAFASGKTASAQTLPPVSVIVCGRNEEENFKQNLPAVLTQDYPEFEVVAVNDQSIDNTKDVLEHLQNMHPHLHIVQVNENERFWNGKKYGLTLGIKAATHQHLIFTDADCIPASPNWLREMANGFAKPNKQIVIGYGAYKRTKGLLNKLIRFETLQSGIQYLSWALWGLPYMGVGRNLAYTKDLFFAQRGFVPHMHIPMGDDDLFVNAAGTRKNTTTVFSKASFTQSEPKYFFADWFEQKRRHIAVSKFYKGFHKWVLGLFAFSQLLFFVALALAAILHPVPVWVWYGFGVRYGIQLLVFTFSAKKTGDWDVLPLVPFLEFFLLINHMAIMIVNTFTKTYRWK